MRIPFETIESVCAEFALLDENAKERLQRYAELLLEWNEKINLTAITEPEEIAVKHFLDCLMFFKYVNVPEGASVIDIGTGAGFPGVVLKIARPDIKLTLLDSLQKRVNFLRTLCDELGLEDVETVHSRAEDGARILREKYDFAVARAVANLPVLSEYCIPYVKVGGSFVALKGASAASEAEAADKAIKALGGKLEAVDRFSLLDSGERGIITVKKISQTPPKYPRNPGKISKQPL
ncbi:MAG: 16S rRNA (guanine(527)-N(7))-methyltransferase RsmG [Ruminococcaceae bacterium]|nr:16S rRNA (guanine(527)-N(7))-methyltransferase RsmG [Oscillospiraceae bacterium]